MVVVPNVKVVNVYTSYNIITVTVSTAWVCVLIALIDTACARTSSLLLFCALGGPPSPPKVTIEQCVPPKVKIEQCVPHAAGNTRDWHDMLLYMCSVEL